MGPLRVIYSKGGRAASEAVPYKAKVMANAVQSPEEQGRWTANDNIS